MFDEAGSKIVLELIEKAKVKNVKIHLPSDFITADKFDEKATVGTTTLEAGIPDGWMVSLYSYSNPYSNYSADDKILEVIRKYGFLSNDCQNSNSNYSTIVGTT